MLATVSGIFIYPVKSLAGVGLKEAKVLPTGLQGDRQWMLVDSKGRFVSQREIPKMATIKTSFDGETLTLSHQQLTPISVSLSSLPAGKPKSFQIWKDTIEGFLEPEEVSQWLTSALGDFRSAPLRLIRFNNVSRRKVGTKYLEQQESNLKLADGCPFLFTFEPSLQTLNKKLPEAMPMDRFRANVVFSGTEPFAEWQWQHLRNARLNFAMIGPCQRCPMTSIDQREGVVATPGQPLQTLMKDFPFGDKNLPYFGQHAHLPRKETGIIKIGDIFKPKKY